MKIIADKHFNNEVIADKKFSDYFDTINADFSIRCRLKIMHDRLDNVNMSHVQLSG